MTSTASSKAFCQQFYADGGRPVPPGCYFRLLLIGYFEGLEPPPLRRVCTRCTNDMNSANRFDAEARKRR